MKTDQEILDWIEANPLESFSFNTKYKFWRRTWGYKDERNRFNSFREAVSFATSDPKNQGKPRTNKK